MGKIRIVVAAAFGVAVFAIAGLALADTSFNTSISANYQSGGSDPYAESFFKGTVKSPKGKCFKDRKVSVTAKSDGEKVGSDFTDKDGKFKVDASGFGAGKYSVKAEKKTFTGGGNAKNKKTCKPDEATVKING